MPITLLLIPPDFQTFLRPRESKDTVQEFLTKRKNERKGEKACRKNWK